MNEREKELAEMKAFVTSAGCMTIEHICVAIRRSRNTDFRKDIRKTMDEIKHYVDLMYEDFNLNFPKKEKKDGN